MAQIIIGKTSQLYQPRNKSFVAQFNKNAIQYINYKNTVFNNILQPNSVYKLYDRADEFITDTNGRLIEVHTNYGISKHPNPELSQSSLYPNCKYYVSENTKQHEAGIKLEHIFETNSFGAVIHVHINQVDFPTIQGDRQPKNKLWIDLGHIIKNLDRGHLVSKQMGGGMEDINLATMSSGSNRLFRLNTLLKHGLNKLYQLHKKLNIPFPNNQKRDIFRTATLNGTTGSFESSSYREFENGLYDLYNNIQKNNPKLYISLDLHLSIHLTSNKNNGFFFLCNFITATASITNPLTNQTTNLYNMKIYVLD